MRPHRTFGLQPITRPLDNIRKFKERHKGSLLNSYEKKLDQIKFKKNPKLACSKIKKLNLPTDFLF